MAIRRWQPIEWFLEGWYEQRALIEAQDPKASEISEEVKSIYQAFFGSPKPPPPLSIQKLQENNVTEFPAVLEKLVENFDVEVQVQLINGGSLEVFDKFFRWAMVYGMFTTNSSPQFTETEVYSDFMSRAEQEIKSVGREHCSSNFPAIVEGYYILGFGEEGVTERIRCDVPQRLLTEEFIRSLPTDSSHRLFISAGKNVSLGFVREVLGATYYYPLDRYHMLCIICSNRGRYQPSALPLRKLLQTDRYFPFIGSLYGGDDEMESGLSWWFIPALTAWGMPYDVY